MYAKNKKGQMHFVIKDLRNRPLLNFEWNRFYICRYFKKRSYMLYKTLLVLTIYLTTYFFTKLFFCFSEDQECNVGLLKQVFPC